ncbi:hypothetical protein D9M69_637170 [compost metagenome]
MLHAAGGAVHAALGGQPELDLLAVGFGAEIEAAIAQLFFKVRHRQCRLAFTLKYHAFAAGLE